MGGCRSLQGASEGASPLYLLDALTNKKQRGFHSEWSEVASLPSITVGIVIKIMVICSITRIKPIIIKMNNLKIVNTSPLPQTEIGLLSNSHSFNYICLNVYVITSLTNVSDSCTLVSNVKEMGFHSFIPRRYDFRI